ncbi:GNAT family N-acetyltransferase [Micromonospora costi]|uniref:GNAT family N-acetyltransferase n=1 Tax=Micromonospora costi TaxID=1530042 RepID=UPI0033F5469C
MHVSIGRADFDDPRLAAFLQAHLDDLAPTAPPESRHALHLDGLRGPDVRLWVASIDGEIAGTGALAALEPGHEELKSMRTDPARRGQGIATRLLDHLLRDARARHVHRISLETGSMEFFAPARALYAKAGFVPCPPFGSYTDDPNSVFMTMTSPFR